MLSRRTGLSVHALVLAIVVLALLLAACNGNGNGNGDTTPSPPVDETTTTTEPDGESATGENLDEGPDPVGEPQLGEVATPDFPFLAGEAAFLVDVRAAAHDGFDRVVLEFDGPEEPNWRVMYVDPPILEDASGRRVEVEGGAFLELRLTPATGVDLTGPEFEETYDGPDRVRIDGNVALEVVRIGDFEQNMAWVIGLDERRPFAVAFFAEPLRLVVDIFDQPA